MDATETKFATELRFFEENRKKWAAEHLEQYAVVHGAELAGFYADFEQALQAGLERYGLGRFLVKQVFPQEPVYAIL
jgi:hypothetical protein